MDGFEELGGLHVGLDLRHELSELRALVFSESSEIGESGEWWWGREEVGRVGRVGRVGSGGGGGRKWGEKDKGENG